jgi:metal transporter CNNM
MDIRYLELMTKGPFDSPKEEKEARFAKALLPMKHRGHQILVMVLLMIALLNSAISILMADIEGSVSGFLLSTSLIVIFAEIIP